MNKQEALKQIEEQRDMILELHGWGVFGYIKGIINQLDEPQKIELPKVDFKKSQKVKVPQFVADYIEESRLKGWDLLASMCFVVSAKNKKTTKWFYLGENKNIFALAWIFGYEVEEEKRYIVSLKNGQPLVKSQSGNTLYFNQNITAGNYKVTRKELEEAGFGWVFDCPGIEIKEVE